MDPRSEKGTDYESLAIRLEALEKTNEVLLMAFDAVLSLQGISAARYFMARDPAVAKYIEMRGIKGFQKEDGQS